MRSSKFSFWILVVWYGGGECPLVVLEGHSHVDTLDTPVGTLLKEFCCTFMQIHFFLSLQQKRGNSRKASCIDFGAGWDESD